MSTARLARLPSPCHALAAPSPALHVAPSPGPCAPPHPQAREPPPMPLWVAISIASAFLQNLRTALQKTLTPRVGVIGATYARFLFAAPWALLLVAVLAAREGMPRPTAAFAAWGLIGAVAQIGATLLLL